ncbi:siderophore-interacting protein [Dermacoccaceae bacterium W4C1]
MADPAYGVGIGEPNLEGVDLEEFQMAADKPARRTPRQHVGEVVRTEKLTPTMIRVHLSGEGLSNFDCGEFTDHYVKLIFPQPGVTYPQPLDMAAIRESFPREQWPTTRTYTVRSWDPQSRALAIDFVVHGDEGLAGPWAASAQPGDTISFMGPGGGYAPSADADWHLLVADESALPAVAASLERLREGAPTHVFIEVHDDSAQQPLQVGPDTHVTWVHSGEAPVGQELVAAVRALDFPVGQIQAFVHGEAGFVKELRRFLRVEQGIPMSDLSISGYWRLGRNEDGWQSSKREWNAEVEAEEAKALG